MPINSTINTLSAAEKFTSELDKFFVQKAVTGFLTDNNLRAQFVGAKTVKIPSLDFVGLVDYDRDNGFSRAKMTVAHEAFTMKMDRGRSIQVDREDMDEQGVSNLAGQVLGEYVRTQVVPECDAYVIKKLCSYIMLDESKPQTVAYNAANPYKVFNELVKNVQDAVGFDEELVCFIDPTAYAAFKNSAEISRKITVSDFKKGEVSTKVQSIDGIPLIPVSSARMKTNFDFVETDSTHNVGGFTPTDDAKDVHMIVMPKKAAHLVKKTEKMRIFTPEQNLDADSYKFDYRIYYDLFVKKSNKNAIWGSFGA